MTDDELKGLFDELRQQNAAAHAETRRDFSVTADRLGAAMHATAADNRHQVVVAIEHFDKRFDLLSESIVAVDEKLDRKTPLLEESLAELQVRVERLESSAP